MTDCDCLSKDLGGMSWIPFFSFLTIKKFLLTYFDRGKGKGVHNYFDELPHEPCDYEGAKVVGLALQEKLLLPTDNYIQI